jgi:hypothetical protein
MAMLNGKEVMGALEFDGASIRGELGIGGAFVPNSDGVDIYSGMVNGIFGEHSGSVKVTVTRFINDVSFLDVVAVGAFSPVISEN